MAPYSAPIVKTLSNTRVTSRPLVCPTIVPLSGGARKRPVLLQRPVSRRPRLRPCFRAAAFARWDWIGPMIGRDAHRASRVDRHAGVPPPVPLSATTRDESISASAASTRRSSSRANPMCTIRRSRRTASTSRSSSPARRSPLANLCSGEAAAELISSMLAAGAWEDEPAGHPF